MPLVLVLLVLACRVPVAHAQEPPVPPTPAEDTPQPIFEDQVEVVAITPIQGLGLDRNKVPANVQVFTANQLEAAAADVASLLASRAASVHVNDVQAGAFQPDVLFRGFTGSPLLGASEGLAVYQDGVRMNEGFGDTVNWDALPAFAIASVNLIPGSNPLFGLNALGGAVSIHTKDGFAHPGARAVLSTGSFGRHQAQAELGGHRGSLGYFVAGALLDESGWRDFSPSTTRRFFGDVSWRGDAATMNVSATAASNDLTGNGTAPAQLLERDRRAVFTHPDRTDNDMALVTIRGQRQMWSRTLLHAVGYYRHTTIGTFNGDAADGADEVGDDEIHFDAINNRSRTRGRASGATAQLTRTAPLWGRDNHFIAGVGVDSAASRFDFSSELAALTADRGTVGFGLFDDEAFVALRSRTTTLSAFLTNAWSLTARLNVSASARFNRTTVRLRDQLGDALSGDHRFVRTNPAAGATYRIAGGVHLYGSYTQASRVPTPVELTCADPDDPCRLPNAFVSDPPLEQVVAATWEGGVRRTGGPLQWTITVFDTSARDDIVFVSSGTLRGEGHFVNVARTRRLGLEASLEYSAADRLVLFGTYTAQRATFGTDLRIASPFHPLAEATELQVDRGDRLPGVPTHSAKLGASGAIAKGLRASTGVRVHSGQVLRGDEANLLAPVPGYAVVDATATQRISARMSVVAQVQNVLGTEYATFGMLGDAGLLGEAFADDPRFFSPGPPRAAWVGLEVRF